MLKQFLMCFALAGSLTATMPAMAGGFNTAPVAVDDTATVMCGTIVGIDVLANDYDPDGDPITVVSAASGGGNAAAAGSFVEFEPHTTGTVYVYYTIEDGNGGIASATVTVNVPRRPACIE
jgi:hypothetical protein